MQICRPFGRTHALQMFRRFLLKSFGGFGGEGGGSLLAAEVYNHAVVELQEQIRDDTRTPRAASCGRSPRIPSGVVNETA